MEPSRELQDLELAILQHDDSLMGGSGRTVTQRLASLVTDIDPLKNETSWPVEVIQFGSVTDASGRVERVDRMAKEGGPRCRQTKTPI